MPYRKHIKKEDPKIGRNMLHGWGGYREAVVARTEESKKLF
jgi:hypothetical protein